jgi:acetoin utilization protein AcuC
MTVSFHQDGKTLFPGSGKVKETGTGDGEGYSVNVPMLPGTDDAAFWKGYSRLFPALMERFAPDVIVTQLGVDTFLEDPLASLEFTTEGFCRVVHDVLTLGIPWVALGGGGYRVRNVVRAWTLAWAIMNGMDLPDQVPEVWTRDGDPATGLDLRLRDEAHESSRQQICEEYIMANVRYLEKEILPRVG